MSNKKHHDSTGDEILEATYDELTHFEDFFAKHWTNIIVGGALLIILFGAYLQGKAWHNAKVSSVSSEIAKAETAAELDMVLKKYPGDKVSDYARMKLAKNHFEALDYVKAGELYAQVASKSRYPDLKAQAAISEAAVLEQSGKTGEAAEKLSAIAMNAEFPDGYRAEANCSAARIYITLKKPERAKSCLDLVEGMGLEGGPSNPYVQYAKQLRGFCEADKKKLVGSQ